MTSGSPGGWPGHVDREATGTSSAKRSRKKRDAELVDGRQRRQVLVRPPRTSAPGRRPGPRRRCRRGPPPSASRSTSVPPSRIAATAAGRRRSSSSRGASTTAAANARQRDGEQRVDADVRVAERRRPRRADRRVGEAADDQPDRDRHRADARTRRAGATARARERRRARPRAVVMAPPGCRACHPGGILPTGRTPRALLCALAGCGSQPAPSCRGRRAAGAPPQAAPPAGRRRTGAVSATRASRPAAHVRRRPARERVRVLEAAARSRA